MATRITTLLILISAFSIQLSAQITTDTKDVQVARQKLQVGTDNTKWVSTIVEAISAASTHRQSPTAKAVYDYVQGIDSTMLVYVDSLFATAGGQVDTFYRSNDTIYLQMVDDALKYVVLPVSVTNLSFTGTTSPVTLNSSTGTDVRFRAGAGISLASAGDSLTVTNTGDTNGGDDITGTLATGQVPYGAGANMVSGNPGFVYTGIRTLNFHTGVNNSGRSRINFSNNITPAIGSGIMAYPNGASSRVNLGIYGNGDTTNLFYIALVGNTQINQFIKQSYFRDSILFYVTSQNSTSPQICFASTANVPNNNYNAKIIAVRSGVSQGISEFGFAIDGNTASATSADLSLYVNNSKYAFAPTGMMIGATSTPVSQLQIIGDGNTSLTYPLIVTNSGGATATASLAINDAQQTSFGTNSPVSTAKVQIESTTQGFLPPRMTTAQRDAISSPAAGLIIYNTSTNKHQGYDGTTWNDFY